MGHFLVWLALGFLMAVGIVVLAAVVLLGILAIAACLMAGECEAVELRRVREIEAEEESGSLDVKV